MRGRTRLWITGVAVFCLLSGCKGEEMSPVIASKGSQESPESLENDGREALKTTLREQISPPDKYEVSFDKGGVAVYGEAVISIPDVETITIKKTVSDSFSVEDFEQFQSHFQSIEDVVWGEEAYQSGENGYTYISRNAVHNGKEYYLNYYQDGQESAGDYARLNYMTVGISTAVRSIHDYETMPEEMKSEEAWEAMGSKAELLLESLGYSDMKLVTRKWVEGVRPKKDDTWDAPIYLREFCFSLAPDGIEAPIFSCVKKQDKNSIYQQYATVTYTHNGVLNGVMIKNKESVIGDSRESVFLLPFSEISAIFESVVKKSYQDYFLYGNSFSDEQKIVLNIKEVRLGYMGIHEIEKNKVKAAGKMIPVWDFLGSVSVEYFKEGELVGHEIYSEPDLSLMTINAMDGSIMER